MDDNYYNKQKIKGICVRCSRRKVIAGKTRCSNCAKEEKEIAYRIRAERIVAGNCVRCSKPVLNNGKVQCNDCLLKQKSQRIKSKLLGKCSLCNRTAIAGKTRCEYHANLVKKYNDKTKDQVFEVYGGYVCKCCGEDIKEFLVIDHINGGGTKHRIQTGEGTNFYRWLKKNNFPDGFQVLCCNCNWGKKICGECPHHKYGVIK